MIGADDLVAECEANEFAASLVMPTGGIQPLLAGRQPTEYQVLDLADRFGVSPLAMANRLQDLGYTIPFPSTGSSSGRPVDRVSPPAR